MKKNKLLILAFALVGASSANAASVTITDPGGGGRTATLDSAVEATKDFLQSGNATAAILSGIDFAGQDVWTERGEEVASGNVGIFDVELTSGAWGSTQAAGTWEITDPNFWSNYGFGAISMHVGGGNPSNPLNSPDSFIWEITNGELTGTWSYNGTGGANGGGLSNLKLYSSGTGTPNPGVPDAGSTLALMGIALAGLGAFKRRK